MNYEWVLAALRRHVEICQNACTFYLRAEMLDKYAFALEGLNEALRALHEVEKAQRKSRVH
jgi:hypothetical protein